MTIHVNVTPTDIAQGVRGSCSACPIAIAVQRCSGWPCSVDNHHVYMLFRRPMPLPFAARAFISGFDLGQKGIPFSFDLEIVEEERSAA